MHVQLWSIVIKDGLFLIKRYIGISPPQLYFQWLDGAVVPNKWEGGCS